MEGLLFEGVKSAILNEEDQLWVSRNNEVLASITRPGGWDINKRDPFFTLEFIADRDGLLSEMFTLSTKSIKNEAYHISGDVDPVKLKFNEVKQNSSEYGIQLSQNVPNPFSESTIISVSSLHDEEIVFRIMDMQGKVVHRSELNISSGLNHIVVKSSMISEDGSTFIQIQNTERTLSGKMIKLN